MATVRPSHLHDASLFDFAGLAVGGKGETDDGVPF
jgi:tRNA 2-thiocytidine biosynthesis protein TtcA